MKGCSLCGCAKQLITWLIVQPFLHLEFPDAVPFRQFQPAVVYASDHRVAGSSPAGCNLNTIKELSVKLRLVSPTKTGSKGQIMRQS
jgi:hypothetical protein